MVGGGRRTVLLEVSGFVIYCIWTGRPGRLGASNLERSPLGRGSCLAILSSIVCSIGTSGHGEDDRHRCMWKSSRTCIASKEATLLMGGMQ